jgi:flagellar hook-associated protein 3 FlgL
MMNRVTEGMKFSLLQESVNNHQTKLGKVEEQIATQKAVNRPSDDPVGVKNILDLRSAKAAVMQYEASLTSADLSLSIPETALASLRGLVAEAKTIAASQCGAGASPENTETLAASVKILIDEALSLMNTRQEDMYLFAEAGAKRLPFPPPISRLMPERFKPSQRMFLTARPRPADNFPATETERMP